MRKDLLILFLGAAPLLGHAEIISVQKAEDTAARFFSNGQSRDSRASRLPLRLVWQGQDKAGRSTSATAPTFYVFNRGTGQGFVIISGDDVVQPVLAYATTGEFGTEQIPENLKHWMESLNEDIHTLRRTRTQPAETVSRAWRQLSVSEPVVQLHTPQWDQTYPYNDKCPAYTGCTITATAEILGYYQWPDQGQGRLGAYTTNGYFIPELTLGHDYQWGKMPYLNGNGLDLMDAEQADAVSTLMRDLGTMVKAQYSWQGTTASLNSVALRLPRHMKYHEGITHVRHDHFSEPAWQQLMKDELDARRPVLFAGYSFGTGHAFVLEGYDSEGLFSVNWGWSGLSNGFYELTRLAPASQGAGGTAAGYDNDQEAVIRIQPKRPGVDVDYFEKMVFTLSPDVGGSKVDVGVRLLHQQKEEIAQGQTIEVTVGRLANLGSNPYEGDLQLAICDARGGVKKVIYRKPDNYLLPGDGNLLLFDFRDHLHITLDDPIEAGDRIRVLYLSRDGQWRPVISNEPGAPWEIVLKKGEAAPAGSVVTTQESTNLQPRALATFSAEVPTTPSEENVEAFYAEAGEGHTLLMRKIEPRGDRLVIPAHTGVVLSTAGSRTFNMLPSSLDAANVPSSNLLRPTSATNTTVDPTENAYILAKKNGEIHFHLLDAADRTIAARHAYLVLTSLPPTASISLQFDEVTGLPTLPDFDSTEGPVYDLTGRRVTAPLKGGIYIQNGKKIWKGK